MFQPNNSGAEDDNPRGIDDIHNTPRPNPRAQRDDATRVRRVDVGSHCQSSKWSEDKGWWTYLQTVGTRLFQPRSKYSAHRRFGCATRIFVKGANWGVGVGRMGVCVRTDWSGASTANDDPTDAITDGLRRQQVAVRLQQGSLCSSKHFHSTDEPRLLEDRGESVPKRWTRSRHQHIQPHDQTHAQLCVCVSEQYHRTLPRPRRRL